VGNTLGVPRKIDDDVPAEVKEVATALVELSHKEGLTRVKLTRLPALLALTSKRVPEASVAECARIVEDMIRTHVNSIRNLRDRVLLTAGLNLDQEADASFEARINRACDLTIGKASPHFIEPESAQGRFRYVLTLDLALRLLGGAPTYAMPRPPSDDLELAIRLQRSHQSDSAVQVLKRVATGSNDQRDRRDAWRLLATVAYESREYDGAEVAFDMALRNVDNMRRGGKLAMAIDRYARLLTEDEEYERALAVVSKALTVFIEGRWLWRRYGCVKWYAGELLDAYSALTMALDLGYPASRVFHARGQVLAELGQYDAAIAELNEALRVPRSSVSRAQAIGARAFALGMSGDLTASLRDFDSASVTIPESGWLWYWRAVCLRHNGRSEEAVVDLERCLTVKSPRLPNPRRDQALRLLESELRSG
jgi:tetratricopeptide (TPR) repeat protein